MDMLEGCEELVLKVQNKLEEIINLLVSNGEQINLEKEGQISLNVPPLKALTNKEYSVSITSPHIVPSGICEVWYAPTLEEALEKCLKDVSDWLEFEKDSPVGHQILLDTYR